MFSLISNLYKHDFKFPLKSFDYTRLRISLRVLEFCGVRGYFGAKNHRQKKPFCKQKGRINLQ
ncbi:hypothetical protein TH0178_13110 [Helicobacter pylori]